jgi:hypothetical protein
MRNCPNCDSNKDEGDFYQRKDGRYQGFCKACLLKTQQDRLKARKLTAVLLLGGACNHCGYARNLACLDFHHVDPKQKEYSWQKMVKRPWNEVIRELKKCMLLCKNCHGEVHNPALWQENVDASKANRNLDKDKVPSYGTLAATGICPTCGEDVYGTKYCSTKCSHVSQRRVEWPSREQLGLELTQLTWTAIGRKYGVSDNAVRKWAKSYGLAV